ncbi:MAG TPA: hypothetical protein VFE47_18420 [Tepidisphaeraceae bacterium]|nr:hypothetical protein [Tepidisphaeraceae bacterium]
MVNIDQDVEFTLQSGWLLLEEIFQCFAPFGRPRSISSPWIDSHPPSIHDGVKIMKQRHRVPRMFIVKRGQILRLGILRLKRSVEDCIFGGLRE